MTGHNTGDTDGARGAEDPRRGAAAGSTKQPGSSTDTPSDPQVGQRPVNVPHRIAHSIRSATSFSTTGNSLFSRFTRSTAATSIGTGTPSPTSGKPSTETSHLQVMDREALLEAHEDGSAALEPHVREPLRLSGNKLMVSDLGIAQSVPLHEPPRMRHSQTPTNLQSPQRQAPEPLFECEEPRSPRGPTPPIPSDEQPVHDRASGTAAGSDHEISSELGKLRNELEPLFRTANIHNGSRLAGLMSQLLKHYTAAQSMGPCAGVTTERNESLCSIVRMVLGVTDNLLSTAPVRSAKMNLLRSLDAFGVKLGLLEPSVGPVRVPQNWALGSVPVLHEQKVGELLDGISTSLSLSTEDDGAYLAPVLRGLGPRLAVPTICYGLPRMPEQRLSSLLELQHICPNVHIYGRKGHIRPAARIIPPFRVPTDTSAPPMSLSLAMEKAQHTSGTLGGYVYPIIDDSNNSLEEFKRATFALTCGHVCVMDAGGEDNEAMIPSPVLMRLFHRALVEERDKHASKTLEWQTYQCALENLDNSKPRALGSLSWSERVVVDGMLSDIALVKVQPRYMCRNTLGDDINMSQYDPALILSSLNLTQVAPKVEPGRKVFKYGSTTKYTAGVTSSCRIVYWCNNKMQSSEFVVRSDTPVFASGGDSGAWVLTKDGSGLSVLGMIHSYEGEFKEFGLFTPMTRILERLQQVTGVPWGVVGVPNACDTTTGDSDL